MSCRRPRRTAACPFVLAGVADAPVLPTRWTRASSDARSSCGPSPEDLFAIEVWFGSRQTGWASPRRIARHVHRQAPPPPPEPASIAATGIDYLGQVLADHEATVSGPTGVPRP